MRSTEYTYLTFSPKNLGHVKETTATTGDYSSSLQTGSSRKNQVSVSNFGEKLRIEENLLLIDCGVQRAQWRGFSSRGEMEIGEMTRLKKIT